MEEIDWRCLNIFEFIDLIRTEELALSFSKRIGLIDCQKKCDCGRDMKLVKNMAKKHGEEFKCGSGRGVCLKRKSILDGSWFSNAKIGIQQGLLCIMTHSAEINAKHYSFFTKIKSSATVADWRSFFRDLYAAELDRTETQKIGGIGLTVEVDESIMFRRKSHVGRLLRGEEAMQWIVGGICRETGDVFAVKVPNRNTETLLSAIIQKIEPGTRVITDRWRGYYSLAAYGYFHDSVNHSFNFVDPNDESIHTQNVERMWKTLKSVIPKESKYEIRWSYLCEFVFKQRNNWFSLNLGERMKLIIYKLKELYFHI